MSDVRDGRPLVLQLQFGVFNLLGGLAVGGAEDRLDVAGLEAVGEVVRHELVRRRDDDGPELVAGEDDGPELVVALEDEHHLVALPDAERLHVVHRAVRVLHHVLEGEAALGEVVGDVEHREALRVAARDLVHDVEGEVEAAGVLEGDVRQAPVTVLLDRDELLHGARRDGRGGRRGGTSLGGAGAAHLRDRLLGLGLGRHDHREERARRAADGDHAVRDRRAVERAVAGAERLLVVADLEAHRAAEDVVVFLSGVRRRRDGLVLELRVEVVGDEVGRRLAVAEVRRHVADLDARLARRDDALAAARDLERGELRRVAFEERHQVDAEDERALVQEGERRVALRRLDGAAFRLRHARLRRQLGDGEALDLAHLADARRDSLQGVLCLHRVHLLVLSCSC